MNIAWQCNLDFDILGPVSNCLRKQVCASEMAVRYTASVCYCNLLGDSKWCSWTGCTGRMDGQTDRQTDGQI